MLDPKINDLGQYELDFKAPLPQEESIPSQVIITAQQAENTLQMRNNNSVGSYFFDGETRELLIDTKQTEINKNEAVLCIYFTDSYNKKTYQYKISVDYQIRNTVAREEVTQAKFPVFPPKFVQSIYRREKTEKGRYGTYKKTHIDKQSFMNIKQIARSILDSGKYNPYVQIND